MKSLISGCALLAALWSGAAAHAAAYSITNLGFVNATALNSHGDVAGGSSGLLRAFLYTAGSFHDLGTLGGSNSSAYDLNDNQQVVGFSNIPGVAGDVHGFLYDGAMQDLGTLGKDGSVARAINSAGVTVGVSNTFLPQGAQAFVYSGGIMTNLNSLVTTPGWDLRDAVLVNDSNQIVGYGMHGGEERAFLLSAGVVTDLGLWVNDSGFRLEQPRDMNNSGQVAGIGYNVATDQWNAFLYTGGSVHYLPPLPGGFGTYGHGINSYGQVVGYGYTSTAAYHAFLYENGQTIDLNSRIDPASGWVLLEADQINDRGQILGTGNLGTFLLTQVPEPSSLVLAALGFMLLAACVWHRNR